MRNIRNLFSKESVGVKLKEGICAELSLKLWFESDWYFCNIKSSKITSEAVCRCSSKRVFLEILQYSKENICVRAIKLQALGQIKLKTLVCFCAYCENFMSSFFYRTPPVAAFAI